MRLPISTHNSDEVYEAKSVEEILETGRSGGNTPYYGTLADRFPFLKKLDLKQEKAIWEHDPVTDMIEASFGD